MYQREDQLSPLLLSGHESGLLCAENRRKQSPLAVSHVRLSLCGCDFSLTPSPPPHLTWLQPVSVSQQEESEEMQQTSAPGAKLLCSLTANCVELIDNQL